jgi:hypothetical protein
MPWHDRGVLQSVCSIAVAGGLLMSAAPVECQEIRVLVIRPPDAKAMPRDVVQIFEHAIREAAPDIAFVTRVAEATDLIEFTSYEDDMLEVGKQGLTSKWQFSFRPLADPEDSPAARARPGNFAILVHGETRDESLSRSAENLRVAMQRLLERSRPAVPK